MANVSRFTAGVEELSRTNPEIFGMQTTEPLTNPGAGQSINLTGTQYDTGFNVNAWANNARLGGGDDIQNLEHFASNPERFGRGQERVLQGLSNRVGAEERAAKARARRARKADVDAGTFERATRGRGMSARQAKSAQRRLGLGRAISIADAGSTSRRTTTDLAIGARRAGAQLENAVFGQEVAGLTSLANAEGQKQVRLAEERANKKARRTSMVGTLIGIGASFLSSEQAKTKKGPAENILDKLRKIRVEKWSYKGDKQEHIGPYAEEFNDTFETGISGRDRINLVDALGVTLGAVKELNEKVEAHAS
jgi:hypothetical protein